MLYKKFIRPILFKSDPEKIHNLTIFLGRFLGALRISRVFRGIFVFRDERLENKVLGIKFENPIGLSAGFDKNAYITKISPPQLS